MCVFFGHFLLYTEQIHGHFPQCKFNQKSTSQNNLPSSSGCSFTALIKEIFFSSQDVANKVFIDCKLLFSKNNNNFIGKKNDD